MKILGTFAVLAGLGVGLTCEISASTCPKDQHPMCPWVCENNHRGEPVCSKCGSRHEPPHHRGPGHPRSGCHPTEGHCPSPHGHGHRGPGHPHGLGRGGHPGGPHHALDISREICPKCHISDWKCATCGSKVHAERPQRG